MRNIWQDRLTAFSFRYQRLVQPYRDMIDVFSTMIERRRGMCIFDVGCGSGRIIELVVHDLALEPSAVTAIDLSPYAIAYARESLAALDSTTPIEYAVRDLSSPDCFQAWPDASYDLVTASLCLQYAQHWDELRQCWTTTAYQRALSELYRLLKPGGQLVFSVDTPDPNFWVLAVRSQKEIFRTWWRAPYLMVMAGILLLQGRELARIAKTGRFHFLPLEQVMTMLEEAGFRDIQHRLTFANLAWAISCRK